ncbi:MAG: SLBB domain-containing protein, partial [Candidatus Omnitrophica bacterium]|nr:SLBB domain-containing protein [Candidatus Omnitrophota bacterium]
RVGLKEILQINKVRFEDGNYRLDPDFTFGFGDTVVINFWGKIKGKYILKIERDGTIVIPFLGKIMFRGLTLDAARENLKAELDKRYTNVEFNLNLGDAQNIQITVLGNLNNPGPMTVTPFFRLAEAISKAGGPNSNGSLIDVKLIRNENEIVSFNIYDFILKGEVSKNIGLKHGDKIYISEIKNLAAIRGDVRYPGIYEFETGETISELINIAGVILSSEIKRKVYVLRVNPSNKRKEVFKEIVFDDSDIEKALDEKLKYGDSIIVTTEFDSVPSAEDLFKYVSITGEIELPGRYLIKEGEKLSSLIKKAQGLKNTAFIKGVIYSRNSIESAHKSVVEALIKAHEKSILEEAASLADILLSKEEKEMRQRALEYRRKALNILASRKLDGRIIIDIEDVINGKTDMTLEEGDTINIPTIPDWVLVTGAVYNPQAIFFKEDKSLEYYLNMVGGGNKYADKEEMYVIKANGQVESKAVGYGQIERGDIVVIPEKIK